MFTLRDVKHSDIDRIVQINKSAIPAVNYVSYNEFEWFLNRKLSVSYTHLRAHET